MLHAQTDFKTAVSYTMETLKFVFRLYKMCTTASPSWPFKNTTFVIFLKIEIESMSLWKKTSYELEPWNLLHLSYRITNNCNYQSDL